MTVRTNRRVNDRLTADAVVAENVDKTIKQGDLLVHAIRHVGVRIREED